MRRPTRLVIIAGLIGGVVLAGLSLSFRSGPGTERIVVGSFSAPTSTPAAATMILPEEVVVTPTGGRAGGGGPVVALAPANGRPFAPAIPFTSTIAVSPALRFILVIGSDARPGERLDRSRADSIHLLAVNPTSGQGTVLGFPRDAWVELPGGSRAKLNDALARGGPQMLADAMRRLTGLPVHYYVLTGFEGLQRMVDELGGVDVFVERRMNDAFSGARFQPGWHRFKGGEALAFARNRYDVPAGDFSRSHNQGALILATLAKMRSEVGDDADLMRWIGVLRRHVQLDVPLADLPELAALSRRLDPTAITNLVVPGRVGTAGGGSVVLFGPEAQRVFVDLRDDAVIGSARPTPTSTTSTTESRSPTTPNTTAVTAPGSPASTSTSTTSTTVSGQTTTTSP